MLRASGSGRRPLWSPLPHQSTLWRSPPLFQGAWSAAESGERFMSQKLFIGGLPFSTSTEQLGELFNQVDGVQSVEVVTDRDTGQSRGFGFAQMATSQAADEAVRKFNGYALGGRTLRVEISKPSAPRGNGGFRSRGGGGPRGPPRVVGEPRPPAPAQSTPGPTPGARRPRGP